jgi:formate dehydrogenase iron-sulfur subunit
MKFICDTERCIDCNGCVTACKNENETALGREPPPGGDHQATACRASLDLGGLHALHRRALHGGVPGRLLLSHRRRHRAARQGPVHRLRLLLYACPFGAPQFPETGAFNHRGKMDKCTFCAGGPEPDNSEAEFRKYGRNRIAEGKLPVCAEQCGTKALLGGDANMIADIYKQRVETRGYGPELWGWNIAYDQAASGGTSATKGDGPRTNQVPNDSQNDPRKLPT